MATKRSLAPVIRYLEDRARKMIPAEYQPEHLVVGIERRNRRTKDAWSDRKVWADIEDVVAALDDDTEGGTTLEPQGSVTQITVAAETLSDPAAVRAALRHEVGHHVVGDPTTKRDRCLDGKPHPTLEAAIKAVGKADDQQDWSGYAEVVALLPVAVVENDDEEEGGTAEQDGGGKASTKSKKWYSLTKVLCLGCGGWARVSTAKPTRLLCGNSGCTHEGQPMQMIGRQP